MNTANTINNVVGGSIIVYRNPAEKAAWEAIMGGEFFPVFVGGLAFVAILVMGTTILRMIGWSEFSKKYEIGTKVLLALGITAWIAITLSMLKGI